MEEVIGREIGGFRIEREIGRGGMGVVYLATQVFPERQVALKLLSSDLASDPAFRERFIRESNAAASTEHPNIVPVFSAGESEGRLYLAMRFIEGMDLRTLLEREGTLSPERATRICAQVADALEAAHERGLVHRDVKPGNVLLDGRDRAYLSDFGLIRRTELRTDITKTGQFMGTVDYVAPEQIKGGEIDGRADVYSLGCVLYECLTGASPFHRDTDVATIYAHLEGAAPSVTSKRPGISPVLRSVVAKAIAKRPEDRFSTAGDMAAALGGGSVPARRWRRRNVLIGLGAGIATLAVGIAILASRNDDPGTAVPPAQSSTTGRIPLDSLVQIDPETGEIVSSPADLPTSQDQQPQVEVGEGGVWVQVGPNVVHVDPSDGAIVGTVTFGAGAGTPSTSIAVGLRTVWVGSYPGIIRINPADDRLLRSVHLSPPGVEVGAGTVSAVGVAIGGASAWGITSDGRLTRVDNTGAKKGTVDVSQSAGGVATGFDTVWTTDDLQGTLTPVDPETLDADAPIAIPGDLDAIAVGAGAVWILDSSAGVVTSVDPSTREVGSPIRVGSGPTDLAVGSGAVWVANNADETISRIDPVTETVETIEVGGPVAAIAVAPSGSLWVVIARLPTNQ